MSWNDKLTQAKSKISSWFFWFWVRQWRTTILVLVLFILIGTFSAYRIPKESFPEVNLGMVTIMTVYPGWNPEDIDSLITSLKAKGFSCNYVESDSDNKIEYTITIEK